MLSCELPEFTAIVYTKENVAAKALADQLCDLAPPTLGRLGLVIFRLVLGFEMLFASLVLEWESCIAVHCVFTGRNRFNFFTRVGRR